MMTTPSWAGRMTHYKETKEARSMPEALCLVAIMVKRLMLLIFYKRKVSPQQLSFDVHKEEYVCEKTMRKLEEYSNRNMQYYHCELAQLQ